MFWSKIKPAFSIIFRQYAWIFSYQAQLIQGCCLLSDFGYLNVGAHASYEHRAESKGKFPPINHHAACGEGLGLSLRGVCPILDGD